MGAHLRETVSVNVTNRDRYLLFREDGWVAQIAVQVGVGPILPWQRERQHWWMFAYLDSV